MQSGGRDRGGDEAVSDGTASGLVGGTVSRQSRKRRQAEIRQDPRRQQMVAALALPSCVGGESSERLLPGNTVQTSGCPQRIETGVDGGRAYSARHRLLHSEER